MTVKQALAFYGLAALVMLPLDVAWLSIAGRRLYAPELGALLLDKPAWVPAAAFYLLYVVGIVVFAISPALREDSWTTALMHGALLGLVAYGTYDLTNLATIRGFTTTVGLIDLAWGTAVTAVSAAAAYGLGKLVGAA